MKTFKITKEVSIERIDPKNWAIVRNLIVKKDGDTKGESLKKIVGYYGKLETAWVGLVDHMALNPSKDLEDTIKRLEELKKPFINFIK